MLRLCYWAVSSSRKSKYFWLCTQQCQNFSSLEAESNSVSIPSPNATQLKLWKRIKKYDPLMNEILKLPETQSRISELAKLMECNQSVIKELIRRSSDVLTLNSLVEKMKLLKAHGFSAEDIVSHPSVLRKSLSLLKTRLQIVEDLQHPSAVTLYGIKHSDEVFERVIQKCRANDNVMKDCASREQFLASLLQCNETAVAGLIANKKLLLSISPALISDKVNTLLKYKISHDYIRKNLCILFHTSVRELDRRLSMLNEKQLIQTNRRPVKLSYMLSSRNEDFAKSFNYLCMQKDSLEGCKDKIEYVRSRLQCDEASAKYFATSPLIKRMSESKLKQVLDYLQHEQKMEPAFILKNKHIFTYSVKRLRERWIVLCNAGYSDVTILPSAAALTDKQFSAKFGSHVFVDTFTSHEE